MSKEKNKPADEILVRQANAGDEEALEELLNRYKPLMRSLANRYYIRGGDHDDVIQEAMIGLFKAVRNFRPEAGLSFAAAASRLSEQSIIDAVRKAEAKKNSILNDSLSLDYYYPNAEEAAGRAPDLPLPAQKSDMEADLEAESAMTLEKVKSQLSEHEYEIMLLRLEGLSYRAIAAKLDLENTKSVDNALQRIRRKLRRNE